MKLNSELLCQYREWLKEEINHLNDGDILVLFNECIDLSLPLIAILCAVIVGLVYGSVLPGFIFLFVVSGLFLLRVL
jgi:hypothetical protein